MTGLLPPAGISREAVTHALTVAEGIASRDRSDLYLTSQLFEDRVRYDAFVAMYAVMRVIDDLVDGVPDKTRLPPDASERLLRELDGWAARLRAAYAGGPLVESIDLALAAAVRTFPVPLESWLGFVDAMRFDVRKPRFDDFPEFLRYAEGAAVAPTSIYVYLLTSTRQPDGRYLVEDFDYATCGRELGLFAYVAHVLRDVRVDLEVGETGLVYLAAADLAGHGLTEADLRALIAGDAPAATWDSWRALVRAICGRARAMRAKGAGMARQQYDSLPGDCAFIFRLIVEMYAELLDRIEADPDSVLRTDAILSDNDRSALVQSIIAATRYRPPSLRAATSTSESP